MKKYLLLSLIGSAFLVSAAAAQNSAVESYSADAGQDLAREIVQSSPAGGYAHLAESSAYSDAVALLRQRQYRRAYESLFALAQDGDARAMREIGWLYADGNGVAADPAAALGWFQEAALAGSEEAMLIFGTALARGLNIDRQPEAARYWLERARESSDREVARSAAEELRSL